MRTSNPTPPHLPAIVWWSIWVSLLGGVFVIGGLFMEKPGVATLPWFVALGPILVAMVLRFLVLPKVTERRKAFVIFIMGISMSEMTGLIGVMAVDQNRETLLLLALLGIVTYMPTFLKKLPAN